MSDSTKSAVGIGCGKLYLVGEYAVMDPKGLAIIAGVNRYIEATATETESDSASDTATVYSDYYGPSGRRYRLLAARDEAGENTIDFLDWKYGYDVDLDIVAATIDVAYRVVAARGVPRKALDIRIVSGLDDAATGKKYGLGSSGAVAVAVAHAIVAAHGVDLSSLEIFKVAFVATLLTGAAGSGGDIACSSHGGIVAYRRPDTEAVKQLVAEDVVSAIFTSWPGLFLQARADLGGLDLAVGWTGQPVKTDAQLARAQASHGTSTQDEQQHGSQSGKPNVIHTFIGEVTAISEEMWAALAADDVAVVKRCIQRNRELLVAFAETKGLNIETAMLGALADSAEEHGAVGKSSGAGGGDCGIALLDRDVDVDALHEQWVRLGIEPLEVEIAPLM